MAYARWDGESDVYVYEAVRGGYTCECGRPGEAFNCETAEEMIAHLLTHRVNGDRVPEDALEALRCDAMPDVVVEEEVDGLYSCRGCPRGSQFTFVTSGEMLAHVLDHQASGAKVAKDTIAALRAAASREEDRRRAEHAKE